MAMQREDLSRRFILDVAACGAVMIRERGQRMREGLPVFSTDTHEQADAIRVLYCRLEKDGSGTYRLNEQPNGVDDLGAISDLFRKAYAHIG
jgi:hypothetical protein